LPSSEVSKHLTADSSRPENGLFKFPQASIWHLENQSSEKTWQEHLAKTRREVIRAQEPQSPQRDDGSGGKDDDAAGGSRHSSPGNEIRPGSESAHQMFSTNDLDGRSSSMPTGPWSDESTYLKLTDQEAALVSTSQTACAVDKQTKVPLRKTNGLY
jgi:hypothetical protein